LINKNESLKKNISIFEEILFRFTIINKNKQYNANDIINNFINIIIPKDEIIIHSFMNETFYIVGLSNKFTGIKSIKQLLKKHNDIDNYNFIIVIQNIQFLPSSTSENFRIYIF
jgi:hypothetical protein